MEQLLITTQKDISRLMAMMYLDIPHYSFRKVDGVDGGVVIELDEENPESLEAFSNRFATWFINEAFVTNGDQYFENSEFEEKWKVWKHDFRFLEAYRDDFYRVIITKRLQEFFLSLDEYFALQVRLEDLFNEVYELTEMRLQLVEEHFQAGIHERYIVLRLQLESQKEAIPSN